MVLSRRYHAEEDSSAACPVDTDRDAAGDLGILRAQVRRSAVHQSAVARAACGYSFGAGQTSCSCGGTHVLGAYSRIRAFSSHRTRRRSNCRFASLHARRDVSNCSALVHNSSGDDSPAFRGRLWHWTGIKIAFGVCHGVFPVIMTVVAGVQNVEPLLLASARSMGASPRQVLFSVIFPHMIPSFFTGLRLAMTSVLFGVLLAELYVSQAGVGHWTTEFAQTFQSQNLFALVAVLAAIAVSLNEMCRWAEARFTRWHRSSASAA